MFDLIQIGFTKKPFSNKGSVRFQIQDTYTESLSVSKAVFINLDGSKVPFLIKHLNLDKNILSLDEIMTPEEASLVSGKEIYLLSDEVRMDTSQDSDTKSLIGYKLFDQNKVERGVIIDKQQLEFQDILIIQNVDSEYKVPLHESLVLELNHNERCLILQMADGLENI